MLEYTLVYQYKIDNHPLIFYLVYFFVSLWCDVYKYVNELRCRRANNTRTTSSGGADTNAQAMKTNAAIFRYNEISIHNCYIMKINNKMNK